MNTKPVGIFTPLFSTAKSGSKTSACGLRLAVTPACNLREEVLTAFHTAKKAGQELDLTFFYCPMAQTTPASSRMNLHASSLGELQSETAHVSATWFPLI